MRRVFWLLAILIFMPVQQVQAEPSDFPRPAALDPQVRFWKNIFTKYSEHQAVIHDDLLLDKVHRVLDFRSLHNSGVSEATYWRQRRAAERKAKAELRDMFRKIQRVNGDKSQLNAEERRFRDQYARYTSRTKWSNAADRVRSQGGLEERFRKAIIISGRYLPYMESVFRKHGLPVELTRLPFVESSFNLHAYSSVAAAGIWQFMPSSGRIYDLRRNDVVDDRRDPWLSTHAAARHLKDDYARLQDWGLAVTAYNFGRAGMARAVSSVRGNGIEHVVKQYKGRRFGFASRNFYASFLAAVDVVENYESHFGKLQREAPVQFDEVKPKHYVEFGTLASLAGMSVAEFGELNPGFLSVVQTGKLRVPPNYVIRVPDGQAENFYQKYAALGPDNRFTSQKSYYVQHRVRRGQSLGLIAQRYGASVQTIMRTNNLRSAHRIRVGQVLKIPSSQGGGGSGSVYAGRSTPASSGTYTVRRGDTLSEIAQRHGTSVSALMAANSLGNARSLRVGQTLTVPGGKGSVAGVTASTHTVRRGDTLSEIAQRYGTSVSALMRTNRLSSARSLRVGQTLTMPGGAVRTAGSYTIQPGDTLSEIASEYGTSVAALKQTNDVDNARSLRVGQTLALPGGSSPGASTTHTVRSGDVLGKIASRYGVSVQSIMQANSLHSAHRLSVGQRLNIPGSAGPRYVSHTVTRGQTLSAIARRYGTSVSSIQRSNNLSNAHSIRVGQTLRIPSG